MMSCYLKNSFFQRFKSIVVNTVYTDFEQNYRQYTSRETQQGKTVQFDDADKRETEKKAHAAMYTAWRNTLHILNPERQFITTVNNDGDLISNDQCICMNWKHKVGLA